MSTTSRPLAPTAASGLARALRDLYVVRAVFAVAWVGIAFASVADATEPSAFLTVLLVVYPLFDAAAVMWQLRAAPDQDRARAVEWVGVAVSVAVAVALAISSSSSISAAVATWGVWAVLAGVPQLVTAIRNRRNGGQVAQMLSGGISVFAGLGFLAQGLAGDGRIAGAAGYAALGAIFFLVSAVRLSATLKQDA